MSTSPERMNEGDRERAEVFARSGIRDLHHLAELIEDERPGVVTYPTIWRYFEDPPKKKNHELLTVIAAMLETNVETVNRLTSRPKLPPRGARTTGRYSNDPAEGISEAA